MITKEVQNWRDDTALQRFQMIAPLLDETLDNSQRIQLRRTIAEKNGLSDKTVKRYLDRYLLNGFQGLRPAERAGNMSSLPENYDELLQEAIQLKREVPTRSVSKIIFILEGENRVPPGVLKRSTLQHHLQKAGFSQKQMRKYSEGRKSSSKRFCKPHRMMLVQADIKYGPYLPIGKDGRKIRTYLSSIIDDHSRFILESRFYDNQEKEIVENTFRKAVLKYGKFDSAYVDNGSQYVSTQLTRSLSRLGIRLLRARPYSGQSKGKIEKFHQIADQFIAEAKAANIKTLEDLNLNWKIFLEEYYHRDSHEGIAEYYRSLGSPISDSGITPEEEWNRDQRPLVFLDANTVGEAFLHHETRVVDKGGCIRFRGDTYEVSSALIGATVEISYDPQQTDTLTVSYGRMEPIIARKVSMGAFCDAKPELPKSMQEVAPETSRFLDILKRNHQKSRKKAADAISFGEYWKEGE